VSEIADAIHADAEAARAEIRAIGACCPSCGVNMADLPRDHMLAISSGRRHEDGPGGAALLAKEPRTAACAGGQPADMEQASFETWQAAMSIRLYDEFRKREDEAFSQMLGWGDAEPE
jgi:hypothetical protein